jgi:hypothetical protein
VCGELLILANSVIRHTQADFRSTDRVQKRLRDEFRQIPDADYFGGRRGGHEDVIRRLPNLLPADTCAQALANFHQDPVIAYHQKSEIWSSDALYSRYFSDDTHAEHIVMAYSLLKCVEARKLYLRSIEIGRLTDPQRQQLELLRLRGSSFLLSAAIAACLETFAGRALPNRFRISFGTKVSPEAAQKLWEPIVDATIPFCGQLEDALKGGLKRSEDASKAILNFRSMVEATKVPNAGIFENFASYLKEA